MLPSRRTSTRWASLTGSSAWLGIAGISAAVCLFLLRKVAVLLFAVALTLNLGLTAFQIARTNVLEATGGPGLAGAVLGWLILVVVIAYTRRMAKRGVLS